MNEMIGRTDLLRTVLPADNAKAATLDLAPLLYRGESTNERRHVGARAGVATIGTLNETLVELAQPAIESRTPVSATLAITNADRAVGATLSGEIARRHGAAGLPDGTVRFRFTGSAGQSFGAFAAGGLTLELEGEANDYFGKGLSGGRLVVRHPRAAQFIPDQTVLVGNTVLYGATSGEAYIAGVAGERFAVRNSGAIAVVEGVGDHGCEYMTGGTVVVLGRIGRNFAAGMSGGMAFLLDEFGEGTEQLKQQINAQLVDIVPVMDVDDRDLLRRLIEQHARYTGSARAKRELGRWEQAIRQFVAVVPREYRQALERRRAEESPGSATRRMIGEGAARHA